MKPIKYDDYLIRILPVSQLNQSADPADLKMVFFTFNDVWFFFSISYTLIGLIDGVGFSFSQGIKDSKMCLKVNRQRKRCDISLE